MSTNVVSAKDIKREKHTIDASGQTLGRLASEVAIILMGKNKPNFVPYLDLGDYVVITNAGKIKLSGTSRSNKIYGRHSGYPGGFSSETFDKLILRKPEYIIEHAVKGMLPQNKLGRKMIKKLKVFAEEAL